MKKRKAIISLLILSLLLTLFAFGGCKEENKTPNTSSSSSSSSSNNNVEVFATHTTYKNVRYGTAKRNVMDISVPQSLILSGETANVILTLHGGAWISGDKEDYAYITPLIIEKGYIHVSMNYSLLQNDLEITYVDMVEEVRTCINVLKARAEKYNIKTDKIALMGYSAGAHLAMQYSYTETDSPIDVSFVVSCSGPSNFIDDNFIEKEATWTDIDFSYRLLLINKLTNTLYTETNYDNEEPFPVEWTEASPVTHITANAPKTLMAYGSFDNLVPFSNALTLEETLQTNGVPYDFFTFPNSGHDLSNDQDVYEDFLLKLFEYLEEAFGG